MAGEFGKFIFSEYFMKKINVILCLFYCRLAEFEKINWKEFIIEQQQKTDRDDSVSLCD